ncbi:hypothetical protein [Mesorhizobium sp. B2-4-6]|uniref:hypothetical protein n=1 Tax=Mesorhizobium sp. B2-4-6 TaxID=2589943 RepID=UPI00112952C0|nr:hypothetical protein [Mesorhizobium sp. B2-4-6]TPL42185.1 hypothetical protein FJ957_24030 [Mesorhizobium sp. B2-4-6]
MLQQKNWIRMAIQRNVILIQADRCRQMGVPGLRAGFFGGAASFFKPDDCIVIRLAIEARPQKGHALTGKDRVCGRSAKGGIASG